ncbi:DUF3800 domain-containing protein [Anoxybacillus sp. EFIL]|uniref:DUF3800 domain-containing protein n=1 Tax=Anoxybacillus sp. EFIL TaxID=2508869 RepID=UPI00148C2EE8|nr:DUF3800 domain-containing protein [Anoxybacillus sp. EFIL]NNU96414.1 DUF3800 domain-containing protein [Anoxybacillus sp. EFIL]
MEYTFFIDESGNTGTDWLNKDQPFFVYGGWLIPNEKIDNVNAYISEFIKKEQSGELKSNKILKRNDGYKIINEIFNSMVCKFSALPIFVVVDKEFMVAAKIVETFFDCAYNPNVNEYLTHPFELKKALANCIFESKDTLFQFSELIKNGTINIKELRNISHQLIKSFERSNHMEVANSLKDLSDENLLSMIDEFETVTDTGRMKNRIALTQTMLLEMLRNIEILLNNRGATVKIIHDKLRGYSTIFNEIQAIFFRKEQPFVYKNEYKIWLSNFPHIDSIEEINSKSSPCIQASDMLCGFIAKAFQAMNSMKSLNKVEKEIIKKLVCIHDEFVKEKVKVWNWYAPYNFDRKFIMSINPNSKVYVTDYHKIIEDDFPNAIK